MSRRPLWKHSISEKDVRWLGGNIIRISYGWKMTGVDTSRDWIELRKETESRRFPTTLLGEGGYFKFAPSSRSLISPTYRGEEAQRDLAAIDEWEKRHHSERAEYERLKAKFEPDNQSEGGGK